MWRGPDAPDVGNARGHALSQPAGVSMRPPTHHGPDATNAVQQIARVPYEGKQGTRSNEGQSSVQLPTDAWSRHNELSEREPYRVCIEVTADARPDDAGTRIAVVTTDRRSLP